MFLVTCPCAFRLRRLAHNAVCGITVRHFPCQFPQKIALVKCLCAFRLRRVARNGCRGTFVLHFPVYTGSSDMSLCLSTAKSPVLGSLHRDVAKKPLIGDLGGDLSKRPLEEICAERALIEILYRDLARRPLWQILYRDLVNRAQILLKDLLYIESSTRFLTLRSLTEIICGDLLKTPCTDSLTQGSCTAACLESLNRDLTLRCPTEIFGGDLL